MVLLGWTKDVVLPLAALAYALFLWYQRDRRKSRAETIVAERTVGADVSSKEAGGLGASVAFVQEAFRVERESKDRQIKAQQTEIIELRAQVTLLAEHVAEKDRKITELERRLARLERSRP